MSWKFSNEFDFQRFSLIVLKRSQRGKERARMAKRKERKRNLSNVPVVPQTLVPPIAVLAPPPRAHFHGETPEEYEINAQDIVRHSFFLLSVSPIESQECRPQSTGSMFTCHCCYFMKLSFRFSHAERLGKKMSTGTTDSSFTCNKCLPSAQQAHALLASRLQPHNLAFAEAGKKAFQRNK